MPVMLPDPLEPVNRLAFRLDTALLASVLEPAARGYNGIMPKRARMSLRYFRRNLFYPGRLANNLLQANWSGAGVETKRFLINSSIGVLGLSDPATVRFGLAASNKDFGLTLGTWGWSPQMYLHVPVLGGRSERDVVGLAGDVLVDPVTYAPGSKMFLRFNELSFSARSMLGLAASEYDPYTLSKLYVTQRRAAEVAGVSPLDLAENTPATQTIMAMLFRPEDSRFYRSGRERSCHPYGFNKPLSFTYWSQPSPSPIAFVMPGLGTHRISGRCIAMAEIAHQAGYHVVVFSSPFNWEFIQCSPAGWLPGYMDEDLELIRRVQDDIASNMKHELGEEKVAGASAQIGMSMGAWYALNLASTSLPGTYRRVLAVNPPIVLEHGLTTLDRLYRTPLGRDDLEAVQRSALLKVLALQQAKPEAALKIPFSDTEAAYMVGLKFRSILAQTLLSIQGISHPSDEVYIQAHSYSYEDYYKLILSPNLAKRHLGSETLAQAGDLRHRAEGLQRAAGDIQVFLTSNDFLLQKEHITWLRQTIGKRVRVDKKGGHMGQMWRPEFREACLKALMVASGQTSVMVK
jgi:ABC-type transporter lipoprotein component MlaA/pimeloyl-ACP methyl ester carboxylesterase